MVKQMTNEESLSVMKSQLILNYIFWATLLLKMQCRFEESVPTGATDGDSIIINPKFWESLSWENKKFLLVHELGHCIFKHHLRRGKREHILWNIACDFVVNNLLHKVGINVPGECLLDSRYDNMSAEAVYTLLLKDAEYITVGKKGKGKAGTDNKFGYTFGEVMDYSGEDPQVNDYEWSGRLEQASRAARSCGNENADLSRLCDINKQSRIPWQEVCQRFVQVKAKNDYDWRRPNQRYITHDMYLPCLRSFEIGKVLFIGDSSGSIGPEEINICASEIQAAAIAVKADFYVMWVDTKVHLPIQQIDPFTYPLKLEPKGGGGTDFRPGFKWVENEDFDPVCVIYITDGFCDSFPSKEPDYPVLWIVTSKDKFEPPFGEVTYWHN